MRTSPATLLAVSHSLLVLALAVTPEVLLRQQRAPFDASSVAASVVRSLPDGWTLGESRSNEIPYGHYWGWKYSGQRGTFLELTGPKPVSILWCDTDGRRHEDPIAVETLKIWLMPPGYRNWPVLVSMHAPVGPERIFADHRVRVYAEPSARLTISYQQFREQILDKATFSGWPERPLSWGSWQADVRQELARRPSGRDSTRRRRFSGNSSAK